MKSLSARSLLPACVISAAAVAALAAPGSALAGVGVLCSGSNIEGSGSSLQAIGQQNVWDPSFNLSTAKNACEGKQGSKGKPEVKYESTSSGKGLTLWGAEESQSERETRLGKGESVATINYAATGATGAKGAFIGTDEPPNETQIENIESHQSIVPHIGPTVATIPVLQGAVAIIVNLPTNCTTATSKGAVGRLVLNNTTLNDIYTGVDTKWSQITDDGDSLKGTGCTPASDTITPIVRLDQSGTTHIFKRYLYLIDQASFEAEGIKSAEEPATWSSLSEGKYNVKWPINAHVTPAAESGGGGLVASVAATPGSVGYANLADARKNGGFSIASKGGGVNEPKFWVELQNAEKTTGSGKTLKTTYTYADPSSNKDVEPQAKANCAKTEYINGLTGEAGEFPPASVYVPWNEVSTKLSSKTYSLCGLSYDLAFNAYHAYTGTTEKEATTVNNFEQFLLEAAGGQKLIGENRDYLALPTTGKLITEARAGAKEISF